MLALRCSHNTTMTFNSNHPHFSVEILSYPVACVKFITITRKEISAREKGKECVCIESVKRMTLIWSCYLSVGVSAGFPQMKWLHCISNWNEVDHLPRENTVIMKLMTGRAHYYIHHHSIGKFCSYAPREARLGYLHIINLPWTHNRW